MFFENQVGGDEFDQTLHFVYDLVGNRLSQTVDKGNDGVIDQVFAYHYDANDRLLEELFDGQNDGTFEKVTNYGYDHTQQTSKTVSENGVLVSDTVYEYDLQGRMSVVTIVSYDENGTIIRQEQTSYGYGADGIRVSALHEIDADGDGVYETKKLTEYLNDSRSITGYSQVLRQTDYDADGNVLQTINYIIGLQRISQITVKNGEVQELYFAFDGHGSTRVLTDFVGAVVQLYSFDAYGNALGFDPSQALTEFLYSGEQFDAKIGQQYLRARYYDPATGRFNRLDPFFGNLGDPQRLHNYLYCHADPITGIDPTGKSLVGAACSIGIGLGIGALVGNTLINSPVNALSVALLGGVFLNPLVGIGILAGTLMSNWNWGHNKDYNDTRLFELMSEKEALYATGGFIFNNDSPSQAFRQWRGGIGQEFPYAYYFGMCPMTQALRTHYYFSNVRSRIIYQLKMQYNSGAQNIIGFQHTEPMLNPNDNFAYYRVADSRFATDAIIFLTEVFWFIRQVRTLPCGWRVFLV